VSISYFTHLHVIVREACFPILHACPRVLLKFIYPKSDSNCGCDETDGNLECQMDWDVRNDIGRWLSNLLLLPLVHGSGSLAHCKLHWLISVVPPRLLKEQDNLHHRHPLIIPNLLYREAGCCWMISPQNKCGKELLLSFHIAAPFWLCCNNEIIYTYMSIYIYILICDPICILYYYIILSTYGFKFTVRYDVPFDVWQYIYDVWASRWGWVDYKNWSVRKVIVD
jgi:hypothetical protein